MGAPVTCLLALILLLCSMPSTAELFWQCCPRKLDPIEMDPECNAPLNPETGEPDSNATMDIFSRSRVIRALRGHPSVVQDVSAQVSEGRDLLFRREDVVLKDIPEVRRKYEYPKLKHEVGNPSNRYVGMLETNPERWTAEESFAVIWGSQTKRFYDPVDDGAAGRTSRSVKWRVVCDKMVEAFRRWVCDSPSERPLSQDDLDVLAEDESLWRHVERTPAAMAAEQGKNVGDVFLNLEALRPFWCWFWQTTVTLRRTRLWSLGIERHIRGFAGFMKKPAVASMLASARRGTFLVRFSASTPGALAIHYVSSREPRQVRDVLVNVTASGSLLCENPDKRNGGRQQQTHKNIGDLVCSMAQLVYVHPNTPKRELFPGHDSRSSSAPSSRHRRQSVVADTGTSRDRQVGGYSSYAGDEPRRRHTISDGGSRVSLGGHIRPRVGGVDRAWAHGEGVVPRIT